MSEPAPSVILFLATVVVATSLVGVLSHQLSLMEGSLIAKKGELRESIEGEIRVVHVTSSGSSLSVYVENLGGVPLDPNQSRVRLNGEWVDPESITVINPRGDELWDTGEVVEINLTATLKKGWNHIAVLNSKLWTPNYRFRGG